MKKKFLFLPVVLITILFSSCSSDDDVIDRLRTLNDIPANADLSIDYLPINIFEIPVEKSLDLRQLIEDELGTDEVLNQVKEIELDDMVIDLVSADDQDNFDFLDSVTLGIKTDDLPYKEVATIDNVPTEVTNLDLNTIDDLYIDEYAKSETLKLVIKFKSTQDAVNLNIKLKMKFDAKLDPSL
ncbi:hypothetical protein [Aequorivita capsosiphonis]|uniref:hypothetical protein n=1 Tax=Aequorivita capsosiphonis TaxID=487317 RepID=UPI00047D0100|nr:hypothetical protein [Aequorivita capsosiphonis]